MAGAYMLSAGLTGAKEVVAGLSQKVQWGELNMDGWDVGPVLSRTLYF